MTALYSCQLVRVAWVGTHTTVETDERRIRFGSTLAEAEARADDELERIGKAAGAQEHAFWERRRPQCVPCGLCYECGERFDAAELQYHDVLDGGEALSCRDCWPAGFESEAG